MKSLAGVDAVERVCATADNADDLLAALSAEFHRVVPHDGSIWMAVDPVTMLSTAPSRVERLDAGLCDTFWHLEFFEQDTAQFADLARGDRASGMRLELGDRVGRSPRYRDFMAPQGYGDELRGVFGSGASSWGAVGLYRESSRRAFSPEEVQFIRSTSRTVGDALRTHLRSSTPAIGPPPGPGLIVVDRHGEAISSNDEAMAWLRELWPLGESSDDVGSFNLFAIRSADRDVPTPLYALAARARAVADGRERAPARLRLRDARGRWIVLHASAVGTPGGERSDSVAVIIQAAASADISPIIIDAYSLTPRERDVLGAIARGGSTAEIAAQLFMSPHTVRDHVKTVFEKVGVASRGELIARLFGEHYADPLHATMAHVD